MGRAKISALRSPYYSNHVGGASITIGAEGSNIINAAIQLKDTANNDLATRGGVKAWLSSDANGDTLLPAYLMPSGGVAIGTDGTLLKGPMMEEGIVVDSTLIIDATTAEQFSTSTTAIYRINGVQYSKAATTDLTFTAAHVITASTFGVVLVQINAAGTISTKVPSATQAYASAALALAALPAPDAGNVALGYIAIANNSGDWTANTDDLTNASDVTTAAFVDAPENAQYSNRFDLISEADGDIDLNITHVGIRTMYLNLLLPDGSKVSSGAITFA